MHSETIRSIGGETIHNIVIGGKSKFHVNDISSKWRAHKKHGGRNYVIKTINEIVQLPIYIDDHKLLDAVLEQIWEAPSNDTFYGIAKSIELDNPIKIAKKTLFWQWKELIEVLLLNSLSQKINVKAEMKQWQAHVANIDTSSTLLYCLFNKKSPWYGKYFDINYNYLGYCPNAQDIRIKALLDFPIDQFVPDKLNHKIKDINNSIENTPSTNITVTLDKGPFAKSTDEFIEQWIEFNKKIQPRLEELELNYIVVAKHIDATSKQISSLIDMANPLTEMR
jgi:hypothetical protein